MFNRLIIAIYNRIPFVGLLRQTKGIEYKIDSLEISIKFHDEKIRSMTESINEMISICLAKKNKVNTINGGGYD